MKYRNVGTYPITLSSGATLAPGEETSIGTLDPHDQDLADQGRLLAIESKSTSKRKDDDS